MIDCEDCKNYANRLLENGDIQSDEVERLIVDRHILKGCGKQEDPLIEWINFAIDNQHGLKQEHLPLHFPEWNKGYLEALNDVKEKIKTLTI